MKFEEFGLKHSVLKGILESGFVEPTEVQAETIPLMMQGEDMVVQAKTGTGKTAAFGIPLLQLIHANERHIKALVVVPVRELSQQVVKEIHALGKQEGIHAVSIYGGQSINIQLQALRRGPQIVVGTPGRLLDLLHRGALDFSKLEFVILDEADKMFEMGFREDVERILQELPQERQTLLFSATMNPDIKQLARKFMKIPVEVNLSQDTLTVEGVKQYYVMVNPRKKVSALMEVLRKQQVEKGVIFCQTKRTVDWLSRELGKRNVHNLAMHGDFTQAKREKTLEMFKHGRSPLLIATNVAARGLHIDNISHVINFELPEEDETYIHRIGRTARQGQTGVAITFLTNLMELRRLEHIQQIANSSVEEIQTEFKY